jgi:hypothetical protein
MHAISPTSNDFPGWQLESEKRIRISMLLSTVVITMMLSMVNLPAPQQVLPLLELVVELTRVEQRAAAEPEILPPPLLPQPVEEPLQEQVAAEPQAQSAPANEAVEDGEPTDWEALRDDAIRMVLDAEAAKQLISINPAFDKLRREAAVRFRASLAPGAVHAWDKVEKDQLGRTILRLGDGSCFRVMDDPSGVNRWAFETFDQHIVYCDFYFGGKKGKELPWVEIIRERYPYLRDPVLIP